MDRSCYCCDRRTVYAGAKENGCANLNVALRELEVLNASGAADKVRLPGFPSAGKIQVMRPNLPNAVSPKRIQGGFCVLHMNKRFVTNFLTSTSSSTPSALLSPERDEPPRSRFCEQRKMVCGPSIAGAKPSGFERCKEQVMNSSLKVRTSRTRFRFQKPYEMPWLRKLEERVRACNWLRERSADEASSTTEGSNGCKSSTGSNPGTPSKSSSSPTAGGGGGGGGSGLMRSRSLDNIASKRWTDVEDIVVVLESKDVENVAQKMKDLQVM